MTWLLTASLFAAAAAPAIAGDGQGVPIPAPAPAPAFPLQPPPPDRPGFVHELGRWWDDARGHLQGFKEGSSSVTRDAAVATGDAMRGAVDATRSAATAIVRLPNTRVVEVHQRCDLAPNGGPDCQQAAINACRIKGFSTGQPLSVQSADNCPSTVLQAGRAPAAGECPVETVVLLAMCQ